MLPQHSRFHPHGKRRSTACEAQEPTVWRARRPPTPAAPPRRSPQRARCRRPRTVDESHRRALPSTAPCRSCRAGAGASRRARRSCAEVIPSGSFVFQPHGRTLFRSRPSRASRRPPDAADLLVTDGRSRCHPGLLDECGGLDEQFRSDSAQSVRLHFLQIGGMPDAT